MTSGTAGGGRRVGLVKMGTLGPPGGGVGGGIAISVGTSKKVLLVL